MTCKFQDPGTWYAGLPGVVMAAGALVTSPAGEVLLVKPNYRDYWTIPGGVCEHGEPPHVGAAREVAEEIGLPVPVGPLLAVDWMQPRGQAERPLMHFVFDGGTLDRGAPIVVQAEELDDYRFTLPGDLPGYLSADGLARVRAALAGRAAAAAVYQPAAQPGTCRA